MKGINSALATGLVVVLASGCISCTLVELREDVQYSSTTQPLTVETLQKIRPGVTDKNWLLTFIGEANDISRYDANRMVWHYDLNESKRQSTKVSLLFRSSSKVKNRCDLSLLMKGDQVEAMWSGSAPETLEKVAENLKRKKGEEPDRVSMCDVFSYSMAE